MSVKFKYKKALGKAVSVSFLDHSNTSGGYPGPVKCIAHGQLAGEDKDCIHIRVWEVESTDVSTKIGNEDYFSLVKSCITEFLYHRGKGTKL